MSREHHRRRTGPYRTRTAMADAFLAALVRWCARHPGAGTMTISAGTVDAGELRRVILVFHRGQTCERKRKSRARRKADSEVFEIVVSKAKLIEAIHARNRLPDGVISSRQQRHRNLSDAVTWLIERWARLGQSQPTHDKGRCG
jgi:hypothetical protein